MIERLAIPAWRAAARNLSDWQSQFETLGFPTAAEPDPDGTWLIVESIGLKALSVMEGEQLTALHCEIEEADSQRALDALRQAAEALDWEIHDETDEDEDNDEFYIDLQD